MKHENEGHWDLLVTVVGWIAITGAFCADGPLSAQNARFSGLPRGEALYAIYCAACHGEFGDGRGPAAESLTPRPRDFTRGKFKIRSTESRELPTDQDLINTITTGMPGTWMPAWDNLSEGDRQELAAYIKTFSGRFERATSPPKKINMGNKIPFSEASIAAGRLVYEELECFTCHGKEGRGDGESASDLIDEWNNPIRTPDLTEGWNFRGGNSVEDIYKRFMSGLAGTPMPSITESFVIPGEVEDIRIKIEDGEPLTAEEREIYESAMEEIRIKTWHLANYVSSLGRERSWIDWLFRINPEEVRKSRKK